MPILQPIADYIEGLDIFSIGESRKNALQSLIDILILSKHQPPTQVICICTHNSRRSHLAQVWLQTMAAYYDLPYFSAYSGGTEETAMYPKVIETLQDAGFKINAVRNSNNPIYSIRYSDFYHPIIGFSKEYDHAFNPSVDFIAIMNCSQAEVECPLVIGASSRISLPYDDPKRYDNHPGQSKAYSDTSQLIATEMKYIFSKLSSMKGMQR